MKKNPRWETTEKELLADLSEDLREAFDALKEFALKFGPQRTYASGKAIMFSKEICYFFVRPRKTFLEVVIFLADSKKQPGFHSVKPASKTKFAHTFKLLHADQIEGAFEDALRSAYDRLS